MGFHMTEWRNDEARLEQTHESAFPGFAPTWLRQVSPPPCFTKPL